VVGLCNRRLRGVCACHTGHHSPGCVSHDSGDSTRRCLLRHRGRWSVQRAHDDAHAYDYDARACHELPPSATPVFPSLRKSGTTSGHQFDVEAKLSSNVTADQVAARVSNLKSDWSSRKEEVGRKLWGREARGRRKRRPRASRAEVEAIYSPGTMRWAVVVPAFMIHTPPCRGLSGSPSDCEVAPGTATVMCGRVRSLSGPMMWYHTDPNSGFTRVPSFSAASNISWALAL